MAIPQGIDRDLLLAAIRDLDAGTPHRFGASTHYDVLFEGRRYAPKAVVGRAAFLLNGVELTPYDFAAGIGTTCFRILERNGFDIVSKSDADLYAGEVHTDEDHPEGSTVRVEVDRIERDGNARKACVDYYGLACSVCGLVFESEYGEIGRGFIHVHHLLPLAAGGERDTDPVADLRPVCPNCHAMLHRKRPPFTIDELRDIRTAAN